MYLAQNGCIHASVPAWAKDEFFEMYEHYKSKEPQFGAYCADHGAKDRQSKRWYDMFIEFPQPPINFLDFNKSLNVKEENGKLAIHSNEFVRYLLSIGFDFGKSHDTQEILNNTGLPEKKKSEKDNLSAYCPFWPINIEECTDFECNECNKF
jgi:hypothetical protein